MKKPINILYELVVLLVVIFIIQFLFHLDKISRLSFGEFHTYWIYLVFLVLLFSITTRTLLLKNQNRRFVSAFCFGFCLGIYQWSLFSINEFKSIYAEATSTNIFSLMFGVLTAALLFALGSSLISSVFAMIINKIWKAK